MHEGIPGYDLPVDHSAVMLEAGGQCPSPPDTRSAPFGSDQATAGVGVSPPALPGQSGLEQPDPFHEAKPRQPPLYLVHTANLGLESLPEPLYQPRKCDPKFIVKGCLCNRVVLPSACMSLDCVHCWSHVGHRRARNVFNRLVSPPVNRTRWYRVPTVIYTVFTIPSELRDKMLDRSEWQKVRKAAWQILKTKFGASFGVEATHPTGDGAVFTFKPHLNFLWIQKAGYKPFLDKGLLWESWGEVLGLKEARVWSKYSDKVKQIRDWSWYVGRPFPGTHEWTGSMRWYGKYPKAKPLDKTVCGNCGAPFKIIGFIDGELLENYYQYGLLTGRDPPWMNDKNITRILPRKAKAC